MARYTGPATRISRRLNVDLVGGDTSFERRPYPPGQHGRARIKQSEYLLQLQEKQKAKYSYGVLEKQFRRYYEEAVRPPGQDRRQPAADPRDPAWTTSSTAPASPAPAGRPASWSATATSWSTATRSTSRATGSRQWDIIDVKPKSLETTPFLIATRDLGDRPVPAWLQVVPNKLRILVH